MKFKAMFAGILIAAAAGSASAQTWDGGEGEPLMPGVSAMRKADKALAGRGAPVPEPTEASTKVTGDMASKERPSQSATATWVSRSLFSKSDALEFAENAKKAFEKAGIQVISAGTYNNFESTGFLKHRAMVVYAGDYRIIKGYKSQWYSTKAECEQAMAQVSFQLAQRGGLILDTTDYREGDETGKFYVFSIDYLQTGG